ncbi:hypothetical protein SAMN05444157_3163 [Frankineae bacterium MT45]|nr:hypothetical protein SAMN05444157_3163 [Frankineae bacterium MT45]
MKLPERAELRRVAATLLWIAFCFALSEASDAVASALFFVGAIAGTFVLVRQLRRFLGSASAPEASDRR